jgi:glycosyltransferase involved in cell wall biosynthesis
LAIAILIFYGLAVFVAVSNLALMRRPRTNSDGDAFCILIPARNEEDNLAQLLPLLTAQSGPSSKIYVFDDESEDQTAKVASELGAVVIRPREQLPAGWAGKNRACHELAKAAAEDSDARWYLFLDADVRPRAEFIAAMRDVAKHSRGCGVLTGFGKMVPGSGTEPLFLAWVGWVLLAFNPFGIVSRTRLGHNRFTNGQMHAWRADIYTRLWPNEQVKGHLMEDVMMGRLLAKENIRVEVVNLSRHISVQMYENWRQTLDGMSKNSFEITGSYLGSMLLAVLFALVAIGWLFAGQLWWLALGLLTLSGIAVSLTVRAATWPVLFMPIVCLIGGFTILRSAWWRKTGQTSWKGRVYAD